MKQNRIGTTDVTVSALSFGCSNMAGMNAPIAAKDAMAVAQTAWDLGLRYYDTAPHYGRGSSEQRLGHFLTGRPRSDYQLSTKVGRVLTPGKRRAFADGFHDPLPNDVHYDYSAAGIIESFASSCARLGVDYVDIIYVHDIGELTHGAEDNARHVADFADSGYAALLKLRAEGKIGAIGLGVNEVEICLTLMDDHPLDVILLAGRWTLLDRSAEAQLAQKCRAAGTSLVQGAIFNSGILATGTKPGAWFDYAPAPDEVRKKVDAITALCAVHDIPMAKVAMHFAMLQDQVASVLIGTSKPASLHRNVAAACDDADLAVIKDIIAACEAHTIRGNT